MGNGSAGNYGAQPNSPASQQNTGTTSAAPSAAAEQQAASTYGLHHYTDGHSPFLAMLKA
jgi:hypothetical protein